MESNIENLKKKYSVALFMDGDCGCALLGEDLQSGEAEFVCVKDVPKFHGVPIPSCPERWAMKQAYDRLIKRLGGERLRYHYPYGGN